MSNNYFWKRKKIACKDTEEHVQGYENYLKTAHWKMLRERIYKERNGICEHCGKELDGVFEVHHKSYKRIGQEKDSDLLLLCPECHRQEHNQTEKPKAERDVLTDLEKAKELNRFADALTAIIHLDFQSLMLVLRFTSMCLKDTKEFETIFNSDTKHLAEYLVWNVTESVEAARHRDE